MNEAVQEGNMMNKTIQALLRGQEENHVLPFFWQHGEDEATLRKMMEVIRNAGCRAVCVESRPHPDFCGEKWWQDMDVILDEARRRGMKVWILDDSHFPTGFANGALRTAPAELCRQGIFLNTLPLPKEAGPVRIDLKEAGMLEAPKKKYSNPMEEQFFNRPPARTFDDDTVLRAVQRTDSGETDVTGRITGTEIAFEKPEGEGELRLLVRSRNAGCHRDYINMTDRDSVRVLIDTVYEPHWQHYSADFGTTIAGFFSDEPELGNGYLYEQGNTLGKPQDLPWGRELEETMRKVLGSRWTEQLLRLWQDDASPETARIHFLYMDALSRLVQRHFSRQIGDWCREHGVMYIGHVIEDNGQHCRTGSSLGHYFRGLEGQDMAGIDDIGGQVLPQGEDEPRTGSMGMPRDGTFYHYGLATLGRSAAALEPRKKGRAMCEIFGAYGWSEGVKLEKYLADHFLVRGINYFVPHAFSGHPFPDPDCPPHFYAHGHHPQYRHFGCLMAYMNRAATLTSSGRHRVPAAVLYHGEAEWCDSRAMPFEKPVRALYDAQIDCHVLPADVFTEAGYPLRTEGGILEANGQRYQAVVVPGCSSLCSAAAKGLADAAAAGVPVIFAEEKPRFVSETGEPLPEVLADCPAVPLVSLADAVRAAGVTSPRIEPENNRIRILEIMGETPMMMIINEGTEPWEGRIIPSEKSEDWYLYDPWMNRCLPAETDGAGILLTAEPLKSLFAIAGDCGAEAVRPPRPGKEIPLEGWTRALCEGAEYPNFSEPAETVLPDGDALAKEQPEFSGFVRYDCRFTLEKDSPLLLTIEDAEEGVEVFLNGESAGIQIAPPFRYELKGRAGENRLRIEVATTLERECYPLAEGYMKMMAVPPSRGSGLTGKVTLNAAET